MAKNHIQFQKGRSLPAFLDTYRSEERCAAALSAWGWSRGFVCPQCSHAEGYSTIQLRGLLHCRRWRSQTSLIAGTVFAFSTLPLTVWFLANYLPAQQKSGIPALQLKRQLGVSSPLAWGIKHRLPQAVRERDAEYRRHGGVTEIGAVYWAGECHGRTLGRGSWNKTAFVAALAKSHDGHPLASRMTMVDGFRKSELAAWAAKSLDPDPVVVSDGLGAFRGIAVAGVDHQGLVTGGGTVRVKLDDFHWLNTVIGKVKNALHGTYRQGQRHRPPRYLDEFCYRFNRCFDLAAMLTLLGEAAVPTPPMPYRLPNPAEAHS